MPDENRDGDGRSLAAQIPRDALHHTSQSPGYTQDAAEDDWATGARLQPTHVEDEPEPTGRELVAKIRRPDDPFPRDRGLPPRSII